MPLWPWGPTEEQRLRARRAEARKAREDALLAAGGRKEAYVDEQGLLRSRVLPRRRLHDRDAERRAVRQVDSADLARGGRWCLVDAQWLGVWLRFVALGALPPEEISNHRLCTADGRVRAGLRLREDYRAVTTGVFAVLQELYGGGPAIFVDVPAGEAAAPWLASVAIDQVAVPDVQEESRAEAEEGASASDRLLVAARLASGAAPRFSDDESDDDDVPLPAFVPRGWLASGARGWRRSFWVLEHGLLREFESAACAPAGRLAEVPVGAIQRIARTTDPRAPDLTVEVCHSGGSVQVAAADSDELEGWLSALHAAIAAHDEVAAAAVAAAAAAAGEGPPVPADLPRSSSQEPGDDLARQGLLEWSGSESDE